MGAQETPSCWDCGEFITLEDNDGEGYDCEECGNGPLCSTCLSDHERRDSDDG